MSDEPTTAPDDDEAESTGGPPRFLFVGGPGRSGTTLMGRTLGIHPLVRYLEESFLLFRYRQVHDVTRALYTEAWPDARADKDALFRPGQVRQQRGAEKARKGDAHRATHRTSRRWLEAVIERLEIPRGVVILDKSPRDVAHYSWGVEHLPRSRYLVMVRDPRAVLASRLEQEERRKQIGYVPGARPSAKVLERAEFWSKQWVDYLAIGEQAHSKNPQRVMFVSYRDMITEPERVAREAQQFIRLSPDAAVPDYLTTGGYRDGLLAEQLDSWQT
ncbi:MAG: sulfotransferase family protein, partial [Acidimicrobiales bacterium]